MTRHIKLQPVARPRVRVRDLAHEVAARPNDVLEFLRAVGEFVRSELSFVEEPVARSVRSHFGSPETEAISPRAVSQAATRGPETREGGLTAPARRRRSENNPFKGELSTFTRPSTPYGPGDAAPPAGEADAISYQTSTARTDTGDYSAAGTYEPSETMKHLEWSLRGMSDTERDVWLAHGLSERHARVAAECTSAGLMPPDLARDVNGYSVLYRVIRGEPAHQVARLLRAAPRGASNDRSA